MPDSASLTFFVPTGPNSAEAMSSVNGPTGTGFAPRYQPGNGAMGMCKTPTPSHLSQNSKQGYY